MTPTPSTPVIARELDELEAALAGDPSADPQLLALVEDVRAERLDMEAGFAARLDERVEAGFPRPDAGPAAWLRGLLEGHRARMLPALGVAATVLLGATATVLLVGGDDGRSRSRSRRPRPSPPWTTARAGARPGRPATTRPISTRFRS